ncbi:MAG: sulfatase-like hydrolase/transferase [Coxiellaceae bacterium]|nr:sulfatase-like hydrolase/transferase [Coxiellaceae bacterium]
MLSGNRGFLALVLITLSVAAFFAQLFVFVNRGTIVLGYLFMAIVGGKITLPPTVIWHLVAFLGAIVLFYAIYTLLIYYLTLLSAKQLGLKPPNYLMLGFLLWLLVGAEALLFNQLNFPSSVYAIFMDSFLPRWLSLSLIALIGAVLFFFVSLAVWRLVSLCLHAIKIRKWLKGVMALVVAVLTFGVFNIIHASHHYHGATAKRPNVIIVGVDSLRPDYVTPENMPFVSKFLKKSVNFSQVYTMLPRTFASYTAILTGLPPAESGVRFSFQSHTKLNVASSLANILKKAGYATYFSIDDSQYMNMTPQFGFDKIDTNGSSVMNHVLSQLDDFPLFNLVSNTAISYWLFPYTFNSRGAHTTYQPRRYVDHVLNSESGIASHPAFLLVHFCLPHWPYAWAGSHFNATTTIATKYLAAVRRVDTQVKNYMAGLKRQGFLRHAIVIVLSDHGEALNKNHGRVVSVSGYRPGVNSQSDIFNQLNFFKGFGKEHFSRSYGHGGDVLSLLQAHTVLAWHLFGFGARPTVSTVAQRASVLDIKPTVLQLLQLPEVDSAQSHSLMPAFYGRGIVDHPYLLFETGYNPSAMYSPPYSDSKIVKEVVADTKINPSSGVVMFWQSAFRRLLQTKQHAVWYKNWYLARLRANRKQPTFALVNLTTQEWTDDMSSSFAKHSPAANMLKMLLSGEQSKA